MRDASQYSHMQHHLLDYMIRLFNTTKSSDIPLIPNSPQHTQGSCLPNHQISYYKKKKNISLPDIPTSEIAVFSMTPNESKHKHAQFPYTKMQAECVLVQKPKIELVSQKKCHNSAYLEIW